MRHGARGDSVAAPAPDRSATAASAIRPRLRPGARRRAARDRPSATATGSPPTAAATTGVPQACASSATSPNDSLWLGTATTSAAR